MLFEGGFTFANFVADAFAIFMFILWFWLLITVSSDLFRRHDISGLGKVVWVILLIVLPLYRHLCLHRQPGPRHGRAHQGAGPAGPR